jgi:integrase
VGSKPFRDISAAFLKHYVLYTLDKRTMPDQVRVLDRFFGDRPIGSIGRAEIEAFFETRLREGKSPATCNRQLSALCTLFAWAVEAGHVAVNVPKGMKRFPECPKEARFLTVEEMARLILAAAPHLKAYLITLAYAGGRMTETLRLKWGRVDLRAATITYSRETVKGKKRTRLVPIVPELRAALLDLRPGPPDTYVFLYNQRPVLSMRTALRTAARRAGLGRVGFHTLRHSFGHFFIERGGPVVLLQRLLGHSTIGLTMRYVHTSAEYVASGAAFMGPKMKKPDADDKDGSGA